MANNLITHSNIPEPYYTHIPLIIFIEYLSSIGGLISLWFGLSFWTLLDNTIELMFFKINRLIRNFKKVLKKNLFLITLFLYIYHSIELLIIYNQKLMFRTS
jgi:hypothetical protein